LRKLSFDEVLSRLVPFLRTDGFATGKNARILVARVKEQEPVQAETRSLSVMDHLREAILSGELSAGTHLQEVRLSQSFGVSRTPVRAALQGLSAAGLLDYEPNRGYVVRTFSLAELIDAYEIRGALEGLAARFAAERGLSDTQSAIIEQALQRGDSVFVTHDQINETVIKTVEEINVTFHSTVLEAASNRLLGQSIELSYQVPKVSINNIFMLDFSDLSERFAEHHAIFEAILARAPLKAETIMRDHVASVKFSAVKALRGQK
jgi:GntR family transcriptional regulator of vanillate catabolism